MPRLDLTAKEATLHKALVVCFDLENFSEFCNQPEPSVAAAVPKLLKRIFDLLNAMLDELGKTNPMSLGTIFNQDGNKPDPSLIKFTGDGALMVWVCREPGADFQPKFYNGVALMMREFQKTLAVHLPKLETELRVQGLPQRVRVSITSGGVYALRPPHSFTMFTEPQDFIGYCINLAVRLQSHCREVRFLMHESVRPEIPDLSRLVARGIKGARKEPVLVFHSDLADTAILTLKKKFEW